MATKAKTLADFKAQYDPDTFIPQRIRAAFAAMLKEGPENWDYESDFSKRAAVSVNQLPKYRDLFAQHIVEAKSASRSSRYLWVADPKVAAKARGNG